MCVDTEKAVVRLSKLEELHFKTDKQLIQLIVSDLDLGIRAACHALNAAEIWNVSAEKYSCKAEQAHSEVTRLLPLTCEVTDDERDRLQAGLEQLGELLEELAAIGSMPIQLG